MGKNVAGVFIRRSPVLNGIFYPENPVTLAAKLASWGLRENLPVSGGQTILAPHGAWDLSGNIAASAFANVQKGGKGPEISRVLLLGAHHRPNGGAIYLSESASFETPLGDLFVDQDLNQMLASCSPFIRIDDIPHLSEHSLEVLLPLVKYCFPKASIVPILMSGKKPVVISALAGALGATMEGRMEKSLIIISSTISRDLDPVLASSMAEEFSTLLENMDGKAYLSRLYDGRISACGGAVVGAMLESGLMEGKHFSSLCTPSQETAETGETVYFGAFSDNIK